MILGKRLTVVVLVLLMILFISVGCANKSVDDSDEGFISVGGINGIEHMEFVYLPEIIPFPSHAEGITNVDNVVLANNLVYFTAQANEDENRQFDVPGIFTMDVDGTNVSPLPNYLPGSFPGGITSGNVYVIAMHADSEGYIWVAELRDLEENEPDDLGVNILRKLDKTGTEISKFDLSNIAVDEYIVYTHALNVDSSGNIYIASMQSIYILDNKGDLLFILDNPDWTAHFVRLSDGTVVFAVWQDRSIYLKGIDMDRRTWGEIISLPSGVMWPHSVLQGTGEYLYLYNDNSLLNGVIAETGEHVNILSWVDSALSATDITGVMFLLDGHIAATRQSQVNAEGALPVTELILLSKTSTDELPNKIQLTFGTFNFDSSIRYAVEQFNNSSATHRIHVIDYSLFNTDADSSAGLLRLTAEIIAGNSPDILDMTGMPVRDYISQGLLIDLYPLLDADTELNRDSIIESVLKASEIDGSLYYVFPSFWINTILGNPMVLGSYPGWNINEFITVLAENPQADIPFGTWTDKMRFLTTALRGNIDEYIDWVNGTTLFNNDDFVRLLELANTFPHEIDTTVGMIEMALSGRQIMEIGFFGMNDYSMWRMLFGGELVFKGIPDVNRDGNSITPSSFIAITSSCQDTEAAWEFVRIFLLEDYQRDALPSWMGNPVNKAVFEEVLERLMIPLDEYGAASAGDGFTSIELVDIELSQAEVDSIRTLVNNTTRMRYPYDTLMEIIEETAADFFNGRMAAQDAARIIQSRTTTYLSERS